MKTIDLYCINELNEEAKKNAIKECRDKCIESESYMIADDYRCTIDKFEQIFNVTLDVDSYGNIKVTNHNDSECMELAGLRAYKYIINNYWDDIFNKKTFYRRTIGTNNNRTRKSRILYTENICLYCDYSYIYVFTQYMNKCIDKNQTVADFIKDCARKISKDYKSEIAELYNNDDLIVEHIELNDLLFTSDGKLVAI